MNPGHSPPGTRHDSGCQRFGTGRARERKLDAGGSWATMLCGAAARRAFPQPGRSRSERAPPPAEQPAAVGIGQGLLKVSRTPPFHHWPQFIVRVRVENRGRRLLLGNRPGGREQPTVRPATGHPTRQHHDGDQCPNSSHFAHPQIPARLLQPSVPRRLFRIAASKLTGPRRRDYTGQPLAQEGESLFNPLPSPRLPVRPRPTRRQSPASTPSTRQRVDLSDPRGDRVKMG